MRATISMELPSRPVRSLERISLRSFLGFVLLFETLLAFQGVDLCDEGFLATYYDNIFSHPESVTYNFMFWMTGIIGGMIAKAVPFLGLWGLRMAGGLCLVATVWTTYRLLEDFISPLSLKVGLIIVLLMHNNDVKVVNYNTLSALCFVITAAFLFRGITEKRNALIALSGAFVALNVAIRIPNLTQLGLLGVLLVAGWRLRYNVRTILLQCLVFGAGFVAGAGLLFALMRAIGHYGFVKDSIGYLFIMSEQKSDAAANAGLYGIKGMINSFRSRNMWAVIFAGTLFGGIIACIWLRDRLAGSKPLLSQWVGFGMYVLFGATLAIYGFRLIDSFSFLSLVIGIVYLLIGLYLITRRDREMDVLMLIAVFFFVMYPIGSAYGIHSAGKFCLWLALPIGLDTLFRLRNTGNEFYWPFTRKKITVGNWLLNRMQWAETSRLVVTVVVFGGLVYQFYYPFYDWHNRFTMVHTVSESPKLRWIGTSASRANLLNDLVLNSRKFIKDDEPVLAYDRMPGYFYITGYRSYLENPFPTVYAAAAFAHDLDKAVNTHTRLPVIVQNLFRTSGNGSNWPDSFEEKDYMSIEENRDRNEVFDAFVAKYGYREVWNNGLFRILVPGNETLSKPQT